MRGLIRRFPSIKSIKNRSPGRDRCTESHGTRAAGEPERTRPASDGIGQYLFSEKIDKRTDHRGATDALSLMVPEPQGSPRGQGPPRMGSGSIFMQSIKILPLAEMGPEADPLLREGGKTRRTGWRRMEGSCLDGGNGILRRREESSWIRMRRSCRQSGSQARSAGCA